MYAVRTYFFMCWKNAGLIQSKSSDYSVFLLLQTCVIFFFRSKDRNLPLLTFPLSCSPYTPPPIFPDVSCFNFHTFSVLKGRCDVTFFMLLTSQATSDKIKYYINLVKQNRVCHVSNWSIIGNTSRIMKDSLWPIAIRKILKTLLIPTFHPYLPFNNTDQVCLEGDEFRVESGKFHTTSPTHLPDLFTTTLASHAGVFRGARFSSKTRSPKNACVGGYHNTGYTL